MYKRDRLCIGGTSPDMGTKPEAKPKLSLNHKAEAEALTFFKHKAEAKAQWFQAIMYFEAFMKLNQKLEAAGNETENCDVMLDCSKYLKNRS